jgi:hypothetical protein
MKVLILAFSLPPADTLEMYAHSLHIQTAVPSLACTSHLRSSSLFPAAGINASPYNLLFGIFSELQDLSVLLLARAASITYDLSLSFLLAVGRFADCPQPI